MMKTLLVILVILLSSVLSGGDESTSEGDITDSWLFEIITDISSDEERSWAKAIQFVDMDRILELMETGLLSFHRADWFAVIDDE